VLRARNLAKAIRAGEKLSRGLRDVASGKALEPVADAMQRRGQKLLNDVFRTSTEPDGSPMAPLVYRVGKPLILTGALSKGALVRVVGVARWGIKLLFEVHDTSDVKAIWHQKGTVRGGPTTDPRRAQNRKSFRSGEAERQHIPARKMLPETAQEAARWIAELEKVGQEKLDKVLQRLAF
jgi:hypothetical protein